MKSLDALFSVNDVPVLESARSSRQIYKFTDVELLGDLRHGASRIETIPPAAYNALMYWYGGGPAVLRRVIASHSSKGTELELFPLPLLVTSCDRYGLPSE
jgi:hypothetical protein